MSAPTPHPPYLYRDRFIQCTGTELVIRWYYLWGRKVIPYRRIAGLERRELRAVAPPSKWRIWGTGTPRYWFNLDPGRPGKTVALVLDRGRWVKPVITPDDPDAVEAIIRQRCCG